MITMETDTIPTSNSGESAKEVGDVKQSHDDTNDVTKQEVGPAFKSSKDLIEGDESGSINTSEEIKSSKNNMNNNGNANPELEQQDNSNSSTSDNSSPSGDCSLGGATDNNRAGGSTDSDNGNNVTDSSNPTELVKVDPNDNDTVQNGSSVDSLKESESLNDLKGENNSEMETLTSPMSDVTDITDDSGFASPIQEDSKLAMDNNDSETIDNAGITAKDHTDLSAGALEVNNCDKSNLSQADTTDSNENIKEVHCSKSSGINNSEVDAIENVNEPTKDPESQVEDIVPSANPANTTMSSPEDLESKQKMNDSDDRTEGIPGETSGLITNEVMCDIQKDVSSDIVDSTEISAYANVKKDSTDVSANMSDSTDVSADVKNDSTEISEDVKNDSPDNSADVKNDSSDVSADVKNDSSDVSADLKNDSTDVSADVKNDSSDVSADVKKDSSDVSADVKNDSPVVSEDVKNDSPDNSADEKNDSNDGSADVKKDSPEVSADVKKDSTEVSEDVKKDSPEVSEDVKKDSTDVSADVKNDSTDVSVDVKKDSTDVAEDVKNDSTDVSADIKKDSTEVSEDINNSPDVSADVKKDSTEVSEDVKKDSPEVSSDVKKDSTDVSADVKNDSTDFSTDVKKDSTDVSADIKKDSPEVSEDVKKDSTNVSADVKNDSTDVSVDVKKGSAEVAEDVKNDSTDVSADIKKDSTEVSEDMNNSPDVSADVKKDSTDVSADKATANDSDATATQSSDCDVQGNQAMESGATIIEPVSGDIKNESKTQNCGVTDDEKNVQSSQQEVDSSNDKEADISNEKMKDTTEISEIEKTSETCGTEKLPSEDGHDGSVGTDRIDTDKICDAQSNHAIDGQTITEPTGATVSDSVGVINAVPNTDIDKDTETKNAQVGKNADVNMGAIDNTDPAITKEINLVNYMSKDGSEKSKTDESKDVASNSDDESQSDAEDFTYNDSDIESELQIVMSPKRRSSKAAELTEILLTLESVSTSSKLETIPQSDDVFTFQTEDENANGSGRASTKDELDGSCLTDIKIDSAKDSHSRDPTENAPKDCIKDLVIAEERDKVEAESDTKSGNDPKTNDLVSKDSGVKGEVQEAEESKVGTESKLVESEEIRRKTDDTAEEFCDTVKPMIELEGTVSTEPESKQTESKDIELKESSSEDPVAEGLKSDGELAKVESKTSIESSILPELKDTEAVGGETKSVDDEVNKEESVASIANEGAKYSESTISDSDADRSLSQSMESINMSESGSSRSGSVEPESKVTDYSSESKDELKPLTEVEPSPRTSPLTKHRFGSFTGKAAAKIERYQNKKGQRSSMKDSKTPPKVPPPNLPEISISDLDTGVTRTVPRSKDDIDGSLLAGVVLRRKPQTRQEQLEKRSDQYLQQKIDHEIRMRDGTAKLLAASKHPQQMLEAAKNLLTSNSRMIAYMSELQRRKTHEVLQKNRAAEGNQTPCQGKVAVSELRIPLMWKDSDHFRNKGDHRRYSVFCLWKIGTEIYDTTILKDVDRSMTDLSFDDVIVFNDIKPDFECRLEVYCHKLCEDLTMASTHRRIKKKFNEISTSVGRSVGKRLSGVKDESDFMSNMLVGPKFEMIANATLKLADITNSTATYDLVTDHSQVSSEGGAAELPLFGHFCCRLAAQPHCMVKETTSGFLRFKNGSTWERHWCLLKEMTLRCYDSPAGPDSNKKPNLKVKIQKNTQVLRGSPGSSSGQDFCFQLSSSSKFSKTQIFAADSEAELEKWWQALQQSLLDLALWQHACDENVEMPVLPTHRQSSYISRQSQRGSLYEEISMKDEVSDSPMSRILARLNVSEEDGDLDVKDSVKSKKGDLQVETDV